jgi:hypothetical protein
MRINLGTRILLVVAVASLSLAAKAQKFQEPSKAELQMTSDPKAPGAPAVFLYREERTDNAGHFFSSYARIKILTEQGKQWATVEVPFVPDISATPIVEARTIHSDGTVIPLSGKAVDVLASKDPRVKSATAVFRIPSPEVGSILEYRWTVPLTKGELPFTVGDPETPLYESLMAKQTPSWQVQQRLFVHKATFYFNPFTQLEAADRAIMNNVTDLTGLVEGERATNLLLTEHLPAGVHVAKNPKGEYFLEVENIPAIPEEPNQPPVESLAYRVDFYYSPYSFADVYWESEIKRWTKQLNHYAEPTPAIRDAAMQIIDGVTTPEAKARKLYDAVQTLENTDFARVTVGAQSQSSQSKPKQNTAQDTWAAKQGTSNDLAVLYLALSKAAGLDIRGIKVADRNQRTFDSKFLSLSQLTSLLAIVRIDGKDIYLDPGAKLCPFAQLDWKHSLAGGIEENSKAPTVTPPNNSNGAITARVADLIVDSQGGVTGTIKILMNGPEALRWRRLNLVTDSDDLKRQISDSFTGFLPKSLTGEVTDLQGLTTSAGYVSVSMKVSGQLGKVIEKRLHVPAFLFNPGTDSQVVSEGNREAPIDMRYTRQVIDDVVYHLPAGYTVESAPQPAQLPWPDHAALVIKTQTGPGTIEIKHIYARAFVLLDAKEYPPLRDYYQKIAASDAQKVVLAPTSSTGGN